MCVLIYKCGYIIASLEKEKIEEKKDQQQRSTSEVCKKISLVATIVLMGM